MGDTNMENEPMVIEIMVGGDDPVASLEKESEKNSFFL